MIHAGRGLLILAVVLSSCGPSSADIIYRYRAPTEAKLAAIRVVGVRVATEFVPTGGPFEFGGAGAGVYAVERQVQRDRPGARSFRIPGTAQARFRLTWENPIANAATILKKGEFCYGSGTWRPRRRVSRTSRG